MTQTSATRKLVESEGMDGTWEQFASQILTAYDTTPDTEQSMAQLLRLTTHQLYSGIVEDAHFRNQFLQCPDTASCGTPTWSTTLYESENIRAGLLSVYRDKPVPFHDHPGAIGVSLILSGVAKIQYANFTRDQRDENLVELQMMRVRERLPGQVCWFFKKDRNIHSVEAITSNVVLLVIHLPHIESNKQSLFFPVVDHQREEGEKFLAHRVKLKRR